MHFKYVVPYVVSVMCFLGNGYCFNDQGSHDNRYPASPVRLKTRYPAQYRTLYKKVKSYFTEEQFDRIMSRRDGIELDNVHRKKLVFIASPQSIAQQKQQHKDWIPLLVNEKTLKNGHEFFQKHRRIFKSAYQKTGVAPGDIISILNWESKLGEKTGTYRTFNIFVGQYFYIDEIEKELFITGAYNKKDAMPRHKALKRLQTIKKRALSNLAQLLMQSKIKGFDPMLVKGSWAGAIGLPQFMPVSMKFAHDGDGDGTIDLNTIPDAIMSVAFYLKLHRYHDKGKKYAFMRYNAEDDYVQGVMLYSQKIEAIGVKPLTEWVYAS
jgi:membrane-bound lytic murein transglycosylase B